MYLPETSAELVSLLVKSIPYPHQMSEFEISETEVRFSWRSVRYRVGLSLHTEEVGDRVLIGSDKSILMEGCLKLRVGLSP